MWLIFAFIAPAFYGVAEVLDNFLTNKLFKNPWALSLASSLFNVCFLPLFFLLDPPSVPPLHTLPIFLLLGLVEFGYLYPYYRGLQSDDTSIVAALFSLGKIFIPVLAFFIVGEKLTVLQYVGVLLIIVSSTLLCLKKEHAKHIFSKSFWYIGLAAFLLSFEGVLLKLLFNEGVTYSTGVGGEMILGLMFALPLFFMPRVRKEIGVQFSKVKVLFAVLIVEELFTFLAFASETYAIDKAPVTVVKAVGTFIPFFVLFYGKLFKGRYPRVFHEHLQHVAIVKKILLFLCMVAGVLLAGGAVQ